MFTMQTYKELIAVHCLKCKHLPNSKDFYARSKAYCNLSTTDKCQTDINSSMFDNEI